MINKNIKFISIDFQKEFTTKEGKWFNSGRSVEFVKNKVILFLQEHKIKISEIISDYRQPRPGDSGDGCYPGTDGYESEILVDVKNKDIWVKCMNSPLWIRDNGGIPDSNPGLPYQDTEKFSIWLKNNIGEPKDVEFVVLIGLTIDCCVLCTAQELTFRGYNVKIIEEATDPAGGEEKYKKSIITKSPLLNWAEVIKWEEFIKNYK